VKALGRWSGCAGQLALAVALLGVVGGVLYWFTRQEGVTLVPDAVLAALCTPTAPALRALGGAPAPPAAAPVTRQTRPAGPQPTASSPGLAATADPLATPVGWWLAAAPAGPAAAPATPAGWWLSTPAAPPNPPTPAGAEASPAPAARTPRPTATALGAAALWPSPTPDPAAPTAVPTATARPAPASAAVAGGVTRVGVRANLLIAPADRKRTLDLAATLGVQWLGQQVVWRDFEGVQGQVDWRFLDEAVHEASGRGFKLLLSVTKAPAWARQGNRINPSAYGDFVAALVGRYKGQVQAIEVYNEPNLAAEWGQRCDVGGYAALLKEAYRRIKAVDPAVVVISAGLTPTGVSDGYTAIDDVAFLQQLKAAGGLGFCDAVGVHVSGFNNPPNAPVNSRCGENPRYGCHASFYVLRYRELQAIARSKPLWVTECGYASTMDPAAGYEYARDNPEGILGDYLAETLKLLRQDGAGMVMWWNLNYAPLAPRSEQAAFGLVDAAWSPRIHYHRLKAELGG